MFVCFDDFGLGYGVWVTLGDLFGFDDLPTRLCCLDRIRWVWLNFCASGFSLGAFGVWF